MDYSGNTMLVWLRRVGDGIRSSVDPCSAHSSPPHDYIKGYKRRVWRSEVPGSLGKCRRCSVMDAELIRPRVHDLSETGVRIKGVSSLKIRLDWRLILLPTDTKAAVTTRALLNSESKVLFSFFTSLCIAHGSRSGFRFKKYRAC